MTDYSRYVGIPFVEGGESFAGCDCLGIVQLYLRNELGITIARPAGYVHRAQRLRMTLDNYAALGFDMIIPRVSEYRKGDVLLLQHGAVPDNFAVVIDGQRMLTSGRKVGSVTASVNNDRVVVAFRHRQAVVI